MRAEGRRSPRRRTEGNEQDTEHRVSSLNTITVPPEVQRRPTVIVVDDLARDPDIDFPIAAFELLPPEPVAVCDERYFSEVAS